MLIGSLLFTGYLTQTLGLRLTSAPKSAFITGLCSVLVPVLAAVVYKIRPQVAEVAGLLVATVGMGLMTLHGSIGAISRGDLLTLACAFAFAAHIVTLGHYSGCVSFELLSVTQSRDVGRMVVGAVVVDGEAARRVAPVRGLRDTGDRIVGHGTGVYHPGVGSAVYYFYPYGTDLHAGAGDGLADFVFPDRGGPLRTSRCGRGPDSGRSGAGGGETMGFAATSILIRFTGRPVRFGDRLAWSAGVGYPMRFFDRLRTEKLLSFTLIVFTLAIGVVIGTLISTGVKAARSNAGNFAPDATPLTIPNAVELPSQFTQIAKQVEPSVVNISTTYHAESDAKPQSATAPGAAGREGTRARAKAE